MTTTTTYILYLDYGRVGDPGVIVQEFTREHDGTMTYTGRDMLCLDDDRFADGDGHFQRWDALLGEHGWQRASPWQDAGDQYSAEVTQC